MAAIQTSTGSIHTLQQTLTSQRREIAELRKLVKLRHDTLEDSTEIEYLRNILFEYMMGRETMVLARVIAAVVKFDQEQTNKILKKEEDKLTLVSTTMCNLVHITQHNMTDKIRIFTFSLAHLVFHSPKCTFLYRGTQMFHRLMRFLYFYRPLIT